MCLDYTVLYILYCDVYRMHCKAKYDVDLVFSYDGLSIRVHMIHFHNPSNLMKNLKVDAFAPLFKMPLMTTLNPRTATDGWLIVLRSSSRQ